MIRICMTRRDGGLELCAAGHAGQAPRGQDIVCAGVSALLYGFVAYLETLPPIATAEADGEVPHLDCSEDDGLLRVVTRGLGGADIRGWEVTAAGLRLIEAAYPACVRLCDGVCPRTCPPTPTPRGKGECNGTK